MNDDLYGTMLEVVQKWVEKYHPGSAYAAIIVVPLDSNTPSVQIPIIPCDLDEPTPTLVV